MPSIALNTAGNYAILAESGISTVPSSAISTLQPLPCFILFLVDLSHCSAGSIAVSPASAASITGFSLTLAPGGTYSTSNQVVGDVYAADYANPTPTTLTTAVSDMQNAYNNAGPALLKPANFSPTSGKFAFGRPSTSN
jgi:hypothetical protein